MKKEYLKYLIFSLILSSISFLTLLSFFDRFENQMYDLKFKNRYYGKAEENSIEDIVIVDIDLRSSEKLGKYYEWPRSYFAKAVDRLSVSNASVTAFDILFDRSNYKDQDSILTEAVKNAGNVITGYSFEFEDAENFIYADSTDGKLVKTVSISSEKEFGAGEYEIMNIGSENILNSALSNGYLGIDSDQDGVIRKVQLVKKYRGKYYPSFALAICLETLDADPETIILNDGKSIEFVSGKDGEKFKIPIDADNYMNIHYKGTWRTFRTISFYDVMESRVGKKTFRDKPVLIGSSLRGLMDLRSTPVQKHFPGVEVQASVVNTILTRDFVKKSPVSVTFSVMLLMILISAGLILTGLHISVSTIIIILAGWLYYSLTNKVFTDYNYVLDVTRPLFALTFAFLTTYAIKYYKENKTKKFIKTTLGKYVPEVVSKELLKDPDRFRLGGEKKEITMLFTDIRSFTSYSEKTEPEELVGFLNVYLKKMTGVIKKNCGTLDKYMGDAIICFFGAPVDIDHPYLACRSALGMMAELKKLKSELEKDTFKNIDIGIGINTDTVTVGNIGSDDLFDYTAIGDGMNLASRLEGLNKYYGTNILVSGNTYEKVKDRFIFRELDEVSVKGKDKPVKMFELLGAAEDELDEKVSEKRLKYSNALKLYRSGDFIKAKEMFSGISALYNDTSSNLMAERCEILIQDTPQEWTGVWKMEGK